MCTKPRMYLRKMFGEQTSRKTHIAKCFRKNAKRFDILLRKMFGEQTSRRIHIGKCFRTNAKRFDISLD